VDDNTNHMSSDAPPRKIPDLSLAQHLFTLRSQSHSSPAYITARDHLLNETDTNSLAPLYLLLKDDLPGWNQSTYDHLKARNDEEEKKLDEKLKEAEEMNGESEVSEALIAKFMFFAKILDKVQPPLDLRLTGSRIVH
jgi:26S proteasome regulatory subunit N7